MFYTKYYETVKKKKRKEAVPLLSCKERERESMLADFFDYIYFNVLFAVN